MSMGMGGTGGVGPAGTPGKGGNPGGNKGPGGGGTGQGGHGGLGMGGLGMGPAGAAAQSPGAASALANGPGRPSNAGGTGQGGAGGGTFQGGTGQTRDTMMEQDQAAANVEQAMRDYNNEGNSLTDTIGNFIGQMFGFNEMDPTRPGFTQPGHPGQTGQADWGWDPAGTLGGALGGALGVPVVGGFLADQLSEALGRPLEVNLGPSVFGGVDGESTVTGPSLTARDGATGEYFGTSPTLAHFANGVSNVAPKSSTFFGTDGSAPQPGPAPTPGPMNLPDDLSPTQVPDGVMVDPGNSGLSPSELSSIFQQYGSKVYKGKNKSKIVA